jgi:hypothetical protein
MKIDLELRPGQSVELLKSLHILTHDGKINQDSRRKLKQVYHLYQFIEPLLKDLSVHGEFAVADLGAGKSYLGFIIYDLFLKNLASAKLFAIESRNELIEASLKLKEKLRFGRMEFCSQTVDEAMYSPNLPAEIQLVTALHACDTATDDAIRFAIAKKAKHIVLVPCCQAEMATQLKLVKPKMLATSPLVELFRHSLHTREFGAHLTNVLRALWLESLGYQVTVTELVGWEHSMKNELIMATYKNLPGEKAHIKLQAILETFNLSELESSRRFTLI